MDIMKRKRLDGVVGYAREHWRRLSLYGSGTLIGLLVAVQVALPWENLPLYTTIDGRDVGGLSKSDAVKQLNEAYKNLPVKLYFGSNTTPYKQPHTTDLGIAVDTTAQVEAKMYPFWLRLVPTSLWWAHTVTGSASPSYTRDADKAKEYVKRELGKSCNITPQNASVEYKDKKLQVVPAVDGGSCDLGDVEKAIEAVSPRLNGTGLRVAMDEKPAKIHDKAAVDLIDDLTEKTKDVSIKADDATVDIPQETLLSWLDFDASGDSIKPSINLKRASDFFDKKLVPKVAIAAGVTKVTTMDFSEISRSNGATGRTLDSGATVELLNKWLKDDGVELVSKTKEVPPAVQYTRKYSPTDKGLSALIAHFAESHSGSFGVSLIEITGSKHRHAAYQDTKQFRTASTYKLFVAYSTIKRIERTNKPWHWSDKITAGGVTKTIESCVEVMIVVSDNACGEALLDKIGFREITDDIQHDIGLSHSSFMGQYIMTTAGDLTTFVGELYAGHLMNSSNTKKLIGYMKRNVYRQGIPAGAKGTVADKVGFLPDPNDGIWYYNDAAIVYGPTGTYALSIMTKGSSWATIAELTRQIEALRAKS